MNAVPPVQANQQRTDMEHLKLLSTFHFVGVGLALLGLLMLYGHYVMMSSVMSNARVWQRQGAPPPPVEMFGVLKWMYVFFALGIGGSGVLNFLSASFIRARRHRLFSLVVAGIDCIYMPLGTILGVFTIVVLMRDSVQSAYLVAPDPDRG